MRFEVLIPVNDLHERHLRRDMEVYNSAAFRHLERITEQFNNPLYQAAMREHERQINDPMFWLMEQASQDAAVKRKERGFWFYRKTTGIINGDKIRKAIIRLIIKLFSLIFNSNSFATRLRAALRKQDKCEGVVKIHSPPIRLIPKTMHPVDSVA
jgi:hypothetical protein